MRFGVKSIELRWINEPREHLDEDGKTIYYQQVRALQYRTQQLDGWENLYWTDWMDVPEHFPQANHPEEAAKRP